MFTFSSGMRRVKELLYTYILTKKTE